LFDCVLIANRGEISVRVARTLRRLGVESVAVYSDADVDMPHVHAADRAVRLGPAPAAESYLSIERIVEAATRVGADAIHPGYGFLSERPDFARACMEAGLTFVGPSPEAMALLGDKIAARDAAAAAGLPVVPGLGLETASDDDVDRWVTAHELPLLVKAAAGGGGKGMRVVRTRAELPEALAAARREAYAAFGDERLLIERYLERPRHLEVQVIADSHGNVLHLGERECSLQRRHQKVIEEAPSPVVDAALRTAMCTSAVGLARGCGYTGAGTVELIADRERPAEFFFLEMNARLQVEHPITEAVTGVDLVRAQLAIAAGEPLPWTQAQLTQTGHAIEVRICAEDPRHEYLPQAGVLALYREPSMPGIRIDSGVIEGAEVPVHYDSLLAKLVARGETREAARQRARHALARFPILGIRTNVPLLSRLLAHERFIAGDLDTHFLEAEKAALLPLDDAPSADARAVADALGRVPAGAPGVRPGAPDPWSSTKGPRV